MGIIKVINFCLTFVFFCRLLEIKIVIFLKQVSLFLDF